MRKAVGCRFLYLFLAGLLVAVYAGPASAKPPPIRIGASLSFEGKYAEPSDMIRIGYQMWVDQVNAAGGLLGRPVELILLDDQSDLARVRDHYRNLILSERVDLLLSPYGSPATMVASELSEQHGYVMIACAAASEKVYNRGYQYLFGLYAPADRFCIGFLDLLARQRLKRAAIVYEQSSFHESIHAGVRHWADIFDIDIVFQEGFDTAGAVFGGVVAALQDHAPDAVIFSSYPQQGYEFIQALKNARYRPPTLFMTVTSVHPDFYQRTGAFAEGIFAPSQWEPMESIPFPGTKRFVTRFRERTRTLPSYHASAAYSACQILEQAVTRTRSLDHRKLREFIYRLDTVTIIGRFKVNESGRQVGHNPLIIQWQNGRKEIVYPTRMKTGEPVFRTSPSATGEAPQ